MNIEINEYCTAQYNNGQKKTRSNDWKMSLIMLIPSTEFSPTVDRKLPLYFIRISSQKLLRQRNLAYF